MYLYEFLYIIFFFWFTLCCYVPVDALIMRTRPVVVDFILSTYFCSVCIREIFIWWCISTQLNRYQHSAGGRRRTLLEETVTNMGVVFFFFFLCRYSIIFDASVIFLLLSFECENDFLWKSVDEIVMVPVVVFLFCFSFCVIIFVSYKRFHVQT